MLYFPTLGVWGWKLSESFVLGPSLAEWQQELFQHQTAEFQHPQSLEAGEDAFLLMCQPRGHKRKQEAFVIYLKIFGFGFFFNSVPLIHPINGQLGRTTATVVFIDVLA